MDSVTDSELLKSVDSGAGFTPEEEELSRRMLSYWADFAKSGFVIFPSHKQ